MLIFEDIFPLDAYVYICPIDAGTQINLPSAIGVSTGNRKCRIIDPIATVVWTTGGGEETEWAGYTAILQKRLPSRNTTQPPTTENTTSHCSQKPRDVFWRNFKR